VAKRKILLVSFPPPSSPTPSPSPRPPHKSSSVASWCVVWGRGKVYHVWLRASSTQGWRAFYWSSFNTNTRQGLYLYS